MESGLTRITNAQSSGKQRKTFVTSGTTSDIINDVSWTVFQLFGTFWGRVDIIYINGALVDEPISP